MLLDFFYRLREADLNVSVTEYLHLLDGMGQQVGTLNIDHFYHFSRLTLIKDESLYDRFDQVFENYWSGQELAFSKSFDSPPKQWLHRTDHRKLSAAQQTMVEALGGWDNLMHSLEERLRKQDNTFHGTKRRDGTARTARRDQSGLASFGIHTIDPSQRRETKVWQQRRYRELDSGSEIDARNFKLALRKLRKMAYQGAPNQFDLDRTICATAHNGGILDIRMKAKRQNAAKILLMLDVGGSMDYHTALCERLFSAARGEFKRLQYFYFHNFTYDRVWQHNSRRYNDSISVMDVIRMYSPDHKVLYVGDATMSPYELTAPGGSVENWNEEAGSVWLQRLLQAFPYSVWINPEKPDFWDSTPSIRMVRDLLQQRMYPLTADGLQDAINALKRPILPDTRTFW